MSSIEALHTELAAYLLRCFDSAELRHFIESLPGGLALANHLPASQVSGNDMATAVVRLLSQENLLQDPLLWDHFRRARERRVREITALQARFRAALAAPPPPDSASALPGTLELLLVSASPVSRARLAVDEEFARIVERLRHRANLHIVQRTAVTFDRLQAALTDHAPHILHISSHGLSGALFFHDPAAGSQKISRAALTRTLRALGQNLQLVVINACDSLPIAEGIVEVRAAPWAIGMQQPIVDDDAITFSVTLYDALAGGVPLGRALEAARARLMVDADEDDPDYVASEIPRLVPADPARADQTALLAPQPRTR